MAVVVNVHGNGATHASCVDWRDERKRTTDRGLERILQLASKPERPRSSGKSMADTWLLAMRCPGYRWRDSSLGSGTELENLLGGAKGKGTSGGPARPKVPKRRAGADCSVVAMKRVTTAERRGQAIRVVIDLVNRRREEPTDHDRGRQLSLDGTSRVTGDSHARFCESCALKAHGIQSSEMATAAKPSSQPRTESCVMSGNGHCEA